MNTNAKALAALLTIGAVGCESGDANKSWSEFSRCMVGDGVTEPSQVAARIRSIELTERQPPELWDAKSQWPGRCEPYANALYSSLGSSTEHKIMKRALKQVGCKDAESPGCKFEPGGAILPVAAELWESAAVAKLEPLPNVDVPLPKFDVQVQSPEGWKPLAPAGYELADTQLTGSGTLRVLMKHRDAPLLICDTAAAGAKCTPVSKDVPKLAYQSVKLLQDDEPILIGLTADGRQAYLATTGESVDFRGSARDGLVIEEGADGAGVLAILMAKGKARGEAEFGPEVTPKEKPVTVDAFASWTHGDDAEVKWQFASVSGKKLKEAASFSGGYAGFLHPCSADGGNSVGIWGRASGQRDAKPTDGNDTAIHASFLEDGTWSKPVSSKMPFRRSVTGSRCSAKRLDVFWAGAEGETLEVGAVACTPSGCKTSTSKWPSFAVQRWIAAGYSGDKFFALWTTTLGETRIRIGDPGNFAAAEEKVLFESADRGGPVFRDLQTFYTSHGAYLLVHDKGTTTLLRVDDKGAVQAVSP